jgi:hypothetical protein
MQQPDDAWLFVVFVLELLRVAPPDGAQVSVGRTNAGTAYSMDASRTISARAGMTAASCQG